MSNGETPLSNDLHRINVAMMPNAELVRRVLDLEGKLKALIPYTRHKADCAYEPLESDCTCGRDALIEI